MIDPENIVRFDRTDAELEELLIFCVCVAGKSAATIAPRVDLLMRHLALKPKQPDHQDLTTFLTLIGIGCGSQKARSILSILNRNFDLRTCTVEDLEKIKGIGPKTSRFFLMSSRQGVDFAAIDTHLLKYLREQGVDKVPKSTPTGKNYLRLEQEFLKRVPEGKTPAEFDLEIWKRYAKI